MTPPKVLLLLLLAVAVGGCNSSPTGPTPPSAPFSSTDLRLGTGAEAQNGRRLTVNYSGWLYQPGGPDNKGTLFDSSAGRGPFSFVLGAGQVIRGWDQSVVGMRVGGLRRLVLPPDLAYGSAGAGNGVIPPNATLIFEIELLDVSP
jgi:FKBP-type peptidyl-prolyl cis-trans isomerase FkpA